MENKEVKVISIPLGVIFAIVAVVIGIVLIVNKVMTSGYTENLTEIANIEETNEKVNLRISETVSARSSETSREETVQNQLVEEEKNDTPVIENNIEEKVEEVEEKETEVADTEIENDNQNYISVEDITISEKMDLTQRTGISREDFIDLMSRVKADTSKFFYNNAGTIYDLCEKYELNEIFFCGLISAESGWNIASNHRSTYNYISLMVNGKLKQFSSVEDGLEQAAKTLHENYLTPGGKFYHGKTLAGVKTRFCPSSSTWTSLVYGRMKQIFNSK